MENALFQSVEASTILKVVVSCLAGALLGLEREFHHKAAGMRTLTLICVGSTLFTILSVEIGFPNSPDRVASNILTGVGFIGAGVIFKGAYSIDGITTAATIWIAAALGIAVGMSHYVLVAIALILVLMILQGLKLVEKKISGLSQKKVICISYDVTKSAGVRFSEQGLISTSSQTGVHDEHGKIPDDGFVSAGHGSKSLGLEPKSSGFDSKTSEIDFPALFRQFHLVHKHMTISRNRNIIENRYEIKGHPKDIKEMSHYLRNNPDICQFEMQTNPM